MNKPILEKIGTKCEFETNTPWYVAVHPHPFLKEKYSYVIAKCCEEQVAIDYVLERNPVPIADFESCLFGCYGTPHQALNAGVEKVESESL
ncbi:hypothetical protein SAMD00079811_54270 [Scytonema sp. HK-05]|uniref:hypothetical protein n=1 Tax=Scytonema sp. HK-05 TaxID=1137095 RepID=UPI0009364DB6|nr:hypothetical protein [Scytonema sp. HK-05]OKH50354.1 hypothetical protein NIES2130_34445 [Scytonema sp. HK-05]BAY47808.1 hypothetical protein SAMD00079811_54270 [Scytonema sp. HK-05]